MTVNHLQSTSSYLTSSFTSPSATTTTTTTTTSPSSQPSLNQPTSTFSHFLATPTKSGNRGNPLQSQHSILSSSTPLKPTLLSSATPVLQRSMMKERSVLFTAEEEDLKMPALSQKSFSTHGHPHSYQSHSYIQQQQSQQSQQSFSSSFVSTSQLEMKSKQKLQSTTATTPAMVKTINLPRRVPVRSSPEQQQYQQQQYQQQQQQLSTSTTAAASGSSSSMMMMMKEEPTQPRSQKRTIQGELSFPSNIHPSSNSSSAATIIAGTASESTTHSAGTHPTMHLHGR